MATASPRGDTGSDGHFGGRWRQPCRRVSDGREPAAGPVRLVKPDTGWTILTARVVKPSAFQLNRQPPLVRMGESLRGSPVPYLGLFYAAAAALSWYLSRRAGAIAARVGRLVCAILTDL